MPAPSDAMPLLSDRPMSPRLPAVTLNVMERLLVLVWLRRYATWCARTGRVERILGTSRLYHRVANGGP